MILIGKILIHKSFGEGTVEEIVGDKIKVKFEKGGQKPFKYPDAFAEGFLRSNDPETQSYIQEEVDRIAKEKQAEEAAKEVRRKAEEQKKAEEEALALIKKKTAEFEKGFGADYHVEHLARQPIYPYREVEELFGIRIAGFGKGINPTGNSVVLISSVEKKRNGFVYHDHWDTNGDYIYSGEGKAGDQKMAGGNKAICEAAENKKPIHLLVKFSAEEYIYQGVFELVDYSLDDEKDEDGNMRKEYKFRLRKKDAH